MMQKQTSIRSLAAAGLLVIALLSVAAWWLLRAELPVRSSLAVTEVLAGDTSGFERALGPRPIAVPRDLGPHPEFKTEWWYFTGNLETEEGRHFGYQLTLFRTALAPESSDSSGNRSDWATNQVYMGHFALTDVGGRLFFARERFSRGAAGLAGASPDSFNVWLENWSMTGNGDSRSPFIVRAAQDNTEIELTIRSLKKAVLQGDRGYDRKGERPGDASFYFSMTRLATTGTVRVGDQTYTVSGSSWLDREWSTSALSPDQEGWDWFALQLDDGRDIMYYQIRERNKTVSPYSDGVVVGKDERVTPLSRQDVQVEVIDYWTSPHSGVRYPSGWRVDIPSLDIALVVRPYLTDQELNVTVRYWEGAVRFEGTATGRPVRGSGYIEMTGYGDQPSLRGSDGETPGHSS